jgi:hypothetical protein
MGFAPACSWGGRRGCRQVLVLVECLMDEREWLVGDGV